MIIPSPIRLLMAIYIIIIATEGYFYAKQCGQKLGGKIGAAGAHTYFVAVSLYLIIEFIMFYFDIYDLPYLKDFAWLNKNISSEYYNSLLAIVAFLSTTMKNWSGKKLNVIDYVKIGIALLGILLVYLYTDMMVNGGYINLLGKIIRP